MLAPWQQTHFDRAIQLFENAQLGHAQLIVGPGGLGKREFTEQLAKRLMCTRAQGAVAACGQCKACALFQAGSHPDWHEITFEENREGKLRSEITIDQLRKLSGILQLSSQLGGPIVTVIQPADAMNFAASNTLLKTLEEPMANRFIFLIANEPGRLSATIRSRCQRMEFRMPSTASALQWLKEQGIDDAVAVEALSATHGNPGQALSWIRQGDVLPLRAQVLAQLDGLANGKAKIKDVMTAWADDERLAMILEFAADRALQRAQEPDQNPKVIRAVGDWFDRVNQTRRNLSTTLRKDLMLHALLLQWQAAARIT